MTADDRSGAGIALRGAPDEYIGEKHIPPSNRGTPAMQVEMTRDVIDNMLASIRDGRAPVIAFGQNPVLEVGESKMVLDASKEEFRNELYATDDTKTDGDNNPEYTYFGPVDYRLVLQKASAANEATSGTDAALQNLKNSMEALRKEKEASKVSIRPDPLHLNDQDRKKRFAAGKAGRGNVLGGRLVAPNSSNASSPAMSAVSPKPTAPTSAPHSSNLSIVQKAIRVSLMHLLAMKPAKLQQIASSIRAPKDDIMAVLSKIGKEQGGEWKLADKAYKELDVFKFPYRSKEDRQQAVDNAIRALDRQRLDPQDKIWQKFLPEEERGKGKTLSKLSLGAPVVAQKSATPNSMKPTQRLKSLTKKVEAKKKEPRKKKAEEDSFGIASRNKAVRAPVVEDSRQPLTKKKPLKNSVGEEKDSVSEKKKLAKATSDEEKERPAVSKTTKRPVPETKEENQVLAKKLKKSVQDDKETVAQAGKKKPLKSVNESGKDSLPQGPQKAAKFSKDGAARAGAPLATSTKLNKEAAQQDQKASAKLSTKKQHQAPSTSGTAGTTGHMTMTSKKATNKTNDQKVSEPNGKTVQPKINGLPFTSTKKVSSVKPKNASSTASPLASSDAEKSRLIHKTSPASSTAVGAGTPGNSDRSLKRKANDLDNDIHKHDVTVKQRKVAHNTPLPNATATATPPNTESSSLKRKLADQDFDRKQPPAKKLAASHKAPKPTQTPTPSYSGASSISSTSSAHSQHPSAGHTHQHDSPQSLHDVSSESPEYISQPHNIRRALDLSLQFKRCYAKYKTLYMSVSNRHGQPPTEKEREEIRQKAAILEHMKKEIKRLHANPEG